MFEPEELMARIVDLEAQLKVSEMAPPSAEQLIACLEGEIAKRDARIMEMENAAESLRLSRDYHHEQEVEYRRRWAGLYAAPVSEAKAQGVVIPEPLMAAITRADDVLHALSNWESSSVKLEQRHGPEWTKEVDAIRRELHTQLARLNAAPVQQVSVPDGWKLVRNSGSIILKCEGQWSAGFSQYDSSTLSRNLWRLFDAMLAAAPAAPAADAGLVEALDYQVLFDAIAAATSVYANGAINISVQAFRAAIAAHRAKGVV